MEANLLFIWFRKLLDALRWKDVGLRKEAPTNGVGLTEGFILRVDGIPIRGRIFFPSPRPAQLHPTVIICHGIPGSGTPRQADDPGYEVLAAEFTRMGLAAVIFNFRGCGESGGNFDMMGWTRDLSAVLDKTLNTPYVDPTRVILVGFSGGGAAATYVAASNSAVYGLAIVGTPAHFRLFEKEVSEIIADFKDRGIIRDPLFPKDAHKWLNSFQEIEPQRWIAQFRGRYLLIMHGENDELIPLEHAHVLADHAPAGVADLVVIPGGVHRLRTDPRCIEALKKWLRDALGWRL